MTLSGLIYPFEFKVDKIIMEKLITIIRCVLIIGIMGCFDSQAFAQSSIHEVEPLNIQVPLNHSKRFRLPRKILNISQSNPTIADVTVFPDNMSLLFEGKGFGTSNFNVEYSNREVQIINIEVTYDLDTLKDKLHELLPGEYKNIEVHSAQSNIVLSGQVSGLDKMQAAYDIANSFLPFATSTAGGAAPAPNSSAAGGGTAITIPSGVGGSKSSGIAEGSNTGAKVINLLSVSGAQQVMLEVKVAEIDRRLAKELNIDFHAIHASDGVVFGALNGGGSSFFSPVVNQANGGGPLGSIASLLQPNSHSINAGGLFLSAISGDFLFNLTVDAAKDQDLAKILAEPTLTTLSGQEASFISGGEFPIPVPQSSATGAGSITIVFKEFGITLRCLPVVLDTGRINLSMNVGVSELSTDAAIATDIVGTDLKFTIPSLTKREAASTLELADGQTMSIAGLISDSVRENVNKFPGLGDVPVLGALFRNERFLKNQTELVIFVTPKLAKPVLASTIVLPTDSFVEPDDEDFYIFGKLEARNADKKVKFKNNISIPNSNQGGMDGQFGHALSEETK